MNKVATIVLLVFALAAIGVGAYTTLAPASTSVVTMAPMPTYSAVAVAPTQSPVDKQVKNLELQGVLDSFFREFIVLDPEWMTQLGDLRQYGVESRDDQLTDRSDAARMQAIRLYKKTLAQLKALEGAELSLSERVTKDVVTWYLEERVAEEPFLSHAYVIDQINGIQTDLPNLMVNIHPMQTKKDAENYVKRLWQFGRIFDQVIEASRSREAKGIIPPYYIIDAVNRQCTDFIREGVEGNILYVSFNKRLKDVEGLSLKEAAFLTNSVAEAVKNVVIPAYERMSAYLDELSAKSTLEAGVHELPNGDVYYQYRLRHYTSTNLTAEQIHNYGLAEVERILAEMKSLYQQIGITGTNMGYNRGRLGGETYTERIDIFRKYNDLYTQMEQTLPLMFKTLPKTRLGLAPVPKDKEGVISNYYQHPSLDGSTPGTFYVNLSFQQSLPHMKPLLYHEGVPGHHLQLTLRAESEELHVVQKVLSFIGYTEGWALYAEKLAGEFGYYSEVRDQLGYLHSELLRAARLVIDTGLHYKKWSRNEAINYLREVTGWYSPQEIDRYIVWPGQAVSYKIGELKMLELRKKAETELGDKFDLREYHDVVLRNGSVPLEVLEAEVLRYIEGNK